METRAEAVSSTSDGVPLGSKDKQEHSIMIYDTPFTLDEEIMIKAISVKGVIRTISINLTGVYYAVHYWNNGDRFETWMYKEELERIGK